jgi:hypothetical protein
VDVEVLAAPGLEPGRRVRLTAAAARAAIAPPVRSMHLPA